MTGQPQTAGEFLRYLRSNLHIYRLLVEVTREARRRRGGQVGIELVLERARWERHLATNGDAPYRLPNAHAAYWARLIMHMNPDLRGVFALRPSKADNSAPLTDSGQLRFWPEAQRDDGWLEEAARAVDGA